MNCKNRLLLACLSLALSAAGAAPQLDPQLRASLQSRVDSGEIAGLVVAVIDGPESAVIGIGKTGATPPDTHTVYEIGSITKTFTGLLLAQAVKSGAVTLEQPVALLLPGFTVPSYSGKPIKLIDLATQTSGLPRLPTNMHPAQGDNPYADYGAAALKEFLASHQLAREPGKTNLYSNLGFGLLGYALSVQAKKPYADLLRDQIAGPLGMSSTATALSPAMRARLAPGHDALGAAVGNWDFDAMAGAGAIRSDAEDMVRYLQAMMAAAPDSAYMLARTPQRPVQGNDMRIGLAWMTSMIRGVPVVWHNGMTGGYASFAGFTADGKRGVVLMTNSAVSLDSVGMALLAPGAPAEPAQVTLPPDVLAGYAGRYQLAPNFVLAIKPTSTGLLSQATGQAQVRAFASARDEFFLRVVDAQLSFKRNAAGAVESLVLHQHGRDMPAPKMVVPKHTAIALDPAILDQYCGRYLLEGTVPVEVTREGAQLYGQAQGQERLMLSALAPDEFFEDDENVLVSFKRNAAGKVTQAVVRQDGRDMMGERQP